MAVAAPSIAPACGFIESATNRLTLREEVAGAKIVLYGTLANAQEGPSGSGATDFNIANVIKSNSKMDISNENMTKTNDAMAKTLVGMSETNKGIARTNALMAESNEKLGVITQTIQKIPGFKKD